MSGVSLADLKHFQSHLERERFMPGQESFAKIDAAFPIGYGQTISQPTLVLYMTDLLALDTEKRVLEIGTGSGYQTAILSAFSKTVYTVERIPELQAEAIHRLNALGCDNIRYRLGDGTQGWMEEAPFDRILVTAAASAVPQELLDQLAPGGRMVIPVGEMGQYLMIVTRDEDGEYYYRRDIPVRFVPLVPE